MGRYKLTSPDMEDVPAFDDLSDAVMAYTRLVTAGTPAKITDEAGLPGLSSVVAEYEGRPTSCTVTSRPLDADTHATGQHAEIAARWYARGFIDAAGALSPFDALRDGEKFAEWYRTSNHIAVSAAWEQFAEQRRKEIDR